MIRSTLEAYDVLAGSFRTAGSLRLMRANWTPSYESLPYWGNPPLRGLAWLGSSYEPTFLGGNPPVLVSHRTSWGILPQTPVFSLRSARCHGHGSLETPSPPFFTTPGLASLGPLFYIQNPTKYKVPSWLLNSTEGCCRLPCYHNKLCESKIEYILLVLLSGGFAKRRFIRGPERSEPGGRPNEGEGVSSEACRAKRENGGLGEDPPGSTMTCNTGGCSLQK